MFWKHLTAIIQQLKNVTFLKYVLPTYVLKYIGNLKKNNLYNMYKKVFVNTI